MITKEHINEGKKILIKGWKNNFALKVGSYSYLRLPWRIDIDLNLKTLYINIEKIELCKKEKY